MSVMGGKRTLSRVESGMVLDQSAERLLLEHEPLEIVRVHSSQAKLRIGLEPEAAIISGLSKDDAPCRALDSQPGEASLDQRASDPVSLPVRNDGYRTKPEPALAPPVDRDWRECHVSYDHVVLRGDE